MTIEKVDSEIKPIDLDTKEPKGWSTTSKVALVSLGVIATLAVASVAFYFVGNWVIDYFEAQEVPKEIPNLESAMALFQERIAEVSDPRTAIKVATETVDSLWKSVNASTFSAVENLSETKAFFEFERGVFGTLLHELKFYPQEFFRLSNAVSSTLFYHMTSPPDQNTTAHLYRSLGIIYETLTEKLIDLSIQ